MIDATYRFQMIGRVMLSKEAEKALKYIAKAKKHDDDNHDKVVKHVASDCLDLLVRNKFVSEVWDDPERANYDEEVCNGYKLTIHGRNYFSNKRRVWLRQNSGALIAAVSSIVSLLVGFALGRIS